MNKRATVLWILGVMIVILTGFSLITEITIAKEKNFGWNNQIYSTSDFSGQYISSIAVDEVQRIWVGLGNDCRIYRYEKGKWSDLNLSDFVQSGCENENITYITFDSIGRAWIGTERSGLILIDGESIKSYNTNNSDIPTNSIGWVFISPENHVWIKSLPVQFHTPYVTTLLLFDGEKWFRIIESGEEWIRINGLTEIDDWDIGDVAVDNIGRIWVIANGLGLIRIEDDGWTEYTPENSGLESIYLSTIEFDPEGRAWIGWNKINKTVGINIFDGENWTSISPIGILEPELEYSDNRANKIAFDLQGRAWIGTGEGLKVFDGEKWVEFTRENSGLSDNAVKHILVDNEGNVWIGTLEGLNVISGDLPIPLSAGKASLYSSIFVWHNFWGLLILLTGVWLYLLFQDKLHINILYTNRTRNWSILLVFLSSIIFGSGIYYLSWSIPTTIDFFIAPFKGLLFVITDKLAFYLVGIGGLVSSILMLICWWLGAYFGGREGNALKGSIMGIWFSFIPGTLIIFGFLSGGWN